ncbi:GNAT family N-acetyltransferase [Roseibium aggregatum]|uniref:Acetyltransferase n=1 Tax=Roseibium aggregatum TaxID=187304 RepID=A0A939EHY8_9HYPH|nr:GNAT family N-acetyltransferase [Roseibium aggregatum]MBN9672772.1 acetyltransferase [Roseibium aggregatum]
MARVAFRPLVGEDLPMLADWMGRPHWREWWGEPEEELAKFRKKIEGRDTTRPFIFQVDGRDAGYIQVWYVKDQQGPDTVATYPWMVLLPMEAVGVDLSIADASQLSKGHGTRVLQAFVGKLRGEGHKRILIDPDPVNLRAVKAYRKAGFREMEDLLGRTGDSLLMEHWEGAQGSGPQLRKA